MKKILIVSIIAAALGSYIYFLEVPAVKQEMFASKFFGDISSSEIESISVESSIGKYELVNSQPQKAKKIDPSKGFDDSTDGLSEDLPPLTWYLSDLKKAVLDRATVEGLVQSVAEASYSKKVESAEQDLSVYGLASPPVSIKVKVNGQVTKIILGDKNEFIDGRYAKLENYPTVYIVDDSLFGEVSKSKDVFRSQMPISFSDSSVKLLTINDESNIIKIEPQADKTFRIIDPVKAKASNFAIFELYRTLRNLQAEQFIDTDTSTKLEDYGFVGSKIKQISLDRHPSENINIKFGIKDTNLYFMMDGQPTIYKSVGDPRNAIFKSLVSLRDAQPFKFDPYLGTYVSVTKDGKKVLSLKSNQGNWEFESDNSKADGPFVREFLKTLSDVTATDFMLIDDVAWSNDPFIKVDLEIDDDGKKSSKSLVVGKLQTGKGYPALILGSNEPFFLSEESVKQITPAEEKFKIVPTPVPAAQATKES